ncbi:MAG: hypothetical protein IPM63_07740 [Acidobacteriota bacterium]|nr:MAG: hypothetical protein IPM63_07740 [Acidobacteriota bacterium]
MKMKNRARFIIRALLAVSAVLMAAQFLPAYGQTCSSITDEQIVDAVYSKFEKNDKISPQINRLNFTIVREPVSGTMQAWKIRGWVDDEKDLDKVMELIRDVFEDLNGATCFGNIKFNQNDLYVATAVPSGFKSEGGCVGDTKPCGDICIPVSETCSITGRTKQSN